ncbi:uncharacterized protein SPSK_02751 [Sporothrix schenckii 1099-18]|uniref:CFEM domain-containing protein n=2 Tax=Sporothrix schenckii TaxID=29908 RepID=U7PQK2_SPOS1|nr:uncharacterized protein SPSK_02751 [Sporothrix schenckii 1099-18]ERS97009.1 hypothetical protein HMPREF1624_06336 [Sporothrix schenckii ATCC 58251]KJR86201.1 hypothetical protein SPSK_02751 [Sporothrix schenckii 1099-18]
MKSFTILALAGLAAAQFAQLPTCAQSCANKFLTGGIGNCGSDAKCICSDKSFLSDIACCLAAPGGCDAADQSSAVVFASQLCAAQGVTVPSAVTCTSTAGGSGTAATATTTTGSGTPTETSGAAATKTDSTSATATGATTSPATTAAAGTTSSKSTNYAPRESAGVGAGLLGGVVAALALL